MDDTRDSLTLAFIREWEGCYLDAYLDVADIWTIGIGTIRYANGVAVRGGDSISMEQAEAELAHEVHGIQSKLALLVTVPQTRNQWAALTSFCYNCGVPSFKTSTLRRRINGSATMASIEAAFLMWVKAHVDGKLRAVKGLTNRRRAEVALYRTPAEAGA